MLFIIHYKYKILSAREQNSPLSPGSFPSPELCSNKDQGKRAMQAPIQMLARPKRMKGICRAASCMLPYTTVLAWQ